MKNKTFYLIAGLNGSGKSTYTKQLISSGEVSFINPDAIQKSKGWTDAQTGREVLTWAKNTLKNSTGSFCLETTLSGRTHINLLKMAKENGWRTEVYFIGLESPQMNIERIERRVQEGGHHIPTESVIRRAERSNKNLLETFNIANRVTVYDNSKEIAAEELHKTIPVFFMASKDGKTFLKEEAPQWVIDLNNQYQELKKKDLTQSHEETLTIPSVKQTSSLENNPINTTDSNYASQYRKGKPVAENISLDKYINAVEEKSRLEVLISYADKYDALAIQEKESISKLKYFKNALNEIDHKIGKIVVDAFKDGDKVMEKLHEVKPFHRAEEMTKMVDKPKGFGKVKKDHALDLLKTQGHISDFHAHAAGRKNISTSLREIRHKMAKQKELTWNAVNKFDMGGMFNDYIKAKSDKERLETPLIKKYKSVHRAVNEDFKKLSDQDKKTAEAQVKDLKNKFYKHPIVKYMDDKKQQEQQKLVTKAQKKSKKVKM